MNRKWGVLGILLAVCLLALAVGGFALLPGAGPGASSAPQPVVSAAPTASPAPAVSAAPQPTPEPTALPAAARPGYPALGPFELEALNTERLPWGQGKQVNELNQPVGSVAYREKYAQYGGLFLAPEQAQPTVYLTFDFGYETGFSGAILDTLAEKQAQATFFLVGSYARNNPDTVRRMLDEGHTVGSHSATHKDMTTLTLSEARAEITGFNDEFEQLYGQRPAVFRFPEGVFSEQLLALAANEGMYSVFWSYATVDWDPENQPDPAEALQNALGAAHPGAIYLLHPMATNSEILGRLIDGLRAAGYTVAPL